MSNTTTTVKNIIKFALDNAALVNYNKKAALHFGKIVYKDLRVYRLMHSVGGDPTIIMEESDGEKLLDDAFKAVEVEGLRLFIVVGKEAKLY